MTQKWSNVIRGVAIGDAWGDPNEFKSINQLIMADPQGPDLPAKLRVTDDTQMTLFLADALDQAHAIGASVPKTKRLIQGVFLDYYSDKDTPSRAPGNTVMGSLGRLNRGLEWQDATDSRSDGSGTVMRTSPAAFVAEDRWVGTAAFAAAVTHGAANGIAAAILGTAVIRFADQINPGAATRFALAMAVNPEKFGLLDVGEWLDGYEVPGGLESGFAELARLLSIALGDLPELQADPWNAKADPSLHITSKGTRGGGWRAHETLVIALLAADMFPADKWAALRRAATTDGDSDTIGAVAGAILGAIHEDEWPDVMDRFEPRYQNWILNEADTYEFAPKNWLKKLLKR